MTLYHQYFNYKKWNELFVILNIYCSQLFSIFKSNFMRQCNKHRHCQMFDCKLKAVTCCMALC